jgi:hypothetical protein
MPIFTEHRIEIVYHGAKYPVEFPVLKPVPVTDPHARDRRWMRPGKCIEVLSDPMLVAVEGDRLAPRFEI